MLRQEAVEPGLDQQVQTLASQVFQVPLPQKKSKKDFVKKGKQD